VTVLEYVLPPVALAVAIFNFVWLAINQRRRKREREVRELAWDRQLERAMGPGNEGVVTRDRKASGQ
jgi:hypothetical protein